VDETFTIDLGEQGAALGVTFDASVDFDATLDVEFSIGIATGGSNEVFLVPGGKVELTFEGAPGDTLANLQGNLHIGFLDLTLQPGSNISLDGRATVTFDDDDTDGRIDLATASVADIANLTISDPDLSDGYFDI